LAPESVAKEPIAFKCAIGKVRMIGWGPTSGDGCSSAHVPVTSAVPKPPGGREVAAARTANMASPDERMACST